MKKDSSFRAIDLSGCEKMILGCIYEHIRNQESVPNLKDIMALVGEKYGIEWKMQTVCTFLSRIECKGLITISKEGRYSYYHPVVPYEVYMKYELHEMCKMYFEDDIKALKKFIRQL